MKSAKLIERLSAEAVTAKPKRGADRTDWDRVRATTDSEVEAVVAADPDEAGMTVDWTKAIVIMPERKRTMTMRLDSDVLDFFQRMGRGYQTRINAILRSYMDHSKG